MDASAEVDAPTSEIRSIPARLGIVLLNLLAPGLGLLRLGRLGAGFGVLFGPIGVLLLLAAIAAVAPTVTFHVVVVVVAFLFLGLVGLYLIPIILTWRWSKRIERTPWWSRWYALVMFALVAQHGLRPVVELFHQRFYKPYYIPAEGMMPTLIKNDRILADMSDRTPRRGEVIIFRTASGADYVKRVAAIGGDSIAMRNGVPIINGVAVDQRAVGTMRIVSDDGRPAIARQVSEELPGERGRHLILDLEHTDFDDMPAVRVPIGGIFVLGDNRDRSADSRVPLDLEGVGIVPLAAVRGRVLFITYSTADWFSRSGTKINP